MNVTDCIYCGETNATRFTSREHVVPQAFGTFGTNTPTLKCVCDGCNTQFGKELDQTLARDTLEGLLRYNQGKFSSERRAQHRLRLTLADESEAGGFVGAAVLGVDPTNNHLMPLATQLQIRNRETGKVDILTRGKLGGFALSEAVYGAPGDRELVVFAQTKEDHDSFIGELNEAGFDLRMDGASVCGITPSVGDDGNATLAVQIEGVFDALHRRALAKILINFAAFYLGKDVVSAGNFVPVKRFVRYGEGELAARISNQPFWTGQETDQLRFPDAINIRLENQELGIVGVIQFYNRITYELLLVEGGLLADEVAARFEIGHAPTIGIRGGVLETAII